MSIEISLLSQTISLQLPPDWIGWLGLLGFLLILIGLQWQWRKFNRDWNASSWGKLGILAVLVPLTSLFVIIRLPINSIPPPGTYIDPGGQAIIVLTAVPWVLAAGLLGPLAAAGLAIASGFVIALWETHSLFTPLEMALLATILAWAIQQRYRTWGYRLLRHPLVSALALSGIYLLVSIASAVFRVSGSLAIRLDYALTQLPGMALSMAVSLIIAGLVAEVVALLAPKQWGNPTPSEPSPAEKQLNTRFLTFLSPLALILLVVLIVGDWYVAGNASRQMLSGLMANNSHTAVQIVPFFVETGQNLIRQLADDEDLRTVSTAELNGLLRQNLRLIPFFTQFFYFDAEGEFVTGYPENDFIIAGLSTDELLGIERAIDGVAVQYYAAPPSGESNQTQFSFIARVKNANGQSDGVLIGRTNFESNPFTQPIISSLGQLNDLNGVGMLVDSDGQVLYHSEGKQGVTQINPVNDDRLPFYEGTAPDGTSALIYQENVPGHPWAVIITIPASIAQQVALGISAPLLLIVLGLVVVSVILLRAGIGRVTRSLETLTSETNRIASGQLDHPLTTQSQDEVGQLSQSFEQMRISLKSRLDELNRLLAATQGVAASLEADQAIRPVLRAALSTGASSARVVLEYGTELTSEGDNNQPEGIGVGPAGNRYQMLDEQILQLARQQDRLLLASANRTRILKMPSGVRPPEAVFSLALRHENHYYGALYLVFESPHQFTEEEQRFLITLSGQAALAAANARLFLTAEIGRQRMEAILASTPDPVLVTDHQNRLLLANPAAWQALGSQIDPGIGRPIEEITKQPALTNLLHYSAEQQQSAEVTLADQRIYLATASTVIAEGHPVGRVCVMRDITHFKEVDALKSEFVSTVSHDLRSPLTLMRGYATMLEMVGNLNDQQTGYVRKIITSVETMSRLVNNLLDLGRIEAGIDLQLEIIPVNDIVERVIGALQLQATQKRIKISYEMPPQTIPLVEADQALLQQALYNLVENAIKYTEPEGKVVVRIAAHDEQMVFAIEDTGIGIAPVDIPRLFEKFYRGAQREARKQTGSGLGLAIVKSIAERHGGKVEIKSQLGQGSTFSLFIPIRQPKKQRSPEPTTRPR